MQTPVVSISKLMEQIDSDHVAIFLAKDRGPSVRFPEDDEALVIFFQNDDHYLIDDEFGWHYMRIWLLDENRFGHLKDTHRHFQFNNDRPLKDIREPLIEKITMARLGDGYDTFFDPRRIPDNRYIHPTLLQDVSFINVLEINSYQKRVPK